MCHECRRGGYVYMKPNRWLCTTCTICCGDPPPHPPLLTSDVITAKEMRERTKKKQSPQTAIASHFGGAENKATGTKGKYQILHNSGLRARGRVISLSPCLHFDRSKQVILRTPHVAGTLQILLRLFFIHDLGQTYGKQQEEKPVRRHTVR